MASRVIAVTVTLVAKGWKLDFLFVIPTNIPAVDSDFERTGFMGSI